MTDTRFINLLEAYVPPEARAAAKQRADSLGAGDSWNFDALTRFQQLLDTIDRADTHPPMCRAS